MNRRYFLDALAALGAFTAVPALAGLDNKVFAAGSHLRIGIVAVGGAGCAIISNLRDKIPQTTSVIAINTDATSLPNSVADIKILIEGGNLSSHNAAREQALNHESSIANVVSSFDLVYIVAGMGGSAGTGIAPLVAEVAQRTANLTIGVAVTPFAFESDRRNAIAKQGVSDLRRNVDAFFEISNERFSESTDKDAQFDSVLLQADQSFLNLYQATVGLSDSTV